MSLPPKKDFRTVTVASAFELSGIAIGLGIGILIGDKFGKTGRKAAAAGLVTLGIISSAPFVYDFISRQIKREGGKLNMNQRLASIREDSGIQDEAQTF